MPNCGKPVLNLKLLKTWARIYEASQSAILVLSAENSSNLDRHMQIFQERIQRKNVLEMFGDEHLIKRLHFLSYSKQAKNIYIIKEHHN